MAALALLLLKVALLCLAAEAAAARTGERDARGQTIVDSSDPQDSPRSQRPLSEAHVVPVALLYDESRLPEEAKRPLRDAAADEEGVGRKDGDEGRVEEKRAQESRSSVKNSKLLSLEERENDENAKYGLGIQSRNKVGERVEEREEEELMKPFVYNIQPLSYYSSETKEQENIINYINKIKEMRESQIKYEAAKKEEGEPPGSSTEEKRPPTEKRHEDAVVTEVEEVDGPIRRRIQHFQAVIKPLATVPQDQAQAYGGAQQAGYPALYPASTGGLYQYPYGQPGFPYQHPGPPTDPALAYDYYQPQPQPTVVYFPNFFASQTTKTKSAATKGILDYFPNLNDYFPIKVNSPYNEFYTAFTNIIEYGPEVDVCRTKSGRRADDEVAAELELPASRKFGLGVKKEEAEPWPKFARLKVRRGGVAIAGPGGIATAGSGGTAIVGPGGTAYTTRDGTAVVGPGGRVVHVPRFPLYADGVDGETEEAFAPPPGARTVAEGPVVFVDGRPASA